MSSCRATTRIGARTETQPKIFLLKNWILDKKKLPHQNLWLHHKLELPKRKLYRRLNHRSTTTYGNRAATSYAA
ncbi:Uncharacterised protein [Neisseria gonorrhoeae]|nr:Uncharacterised protein [Neisseria gonorrhoeae]